MHEKQGKGKSMVYILSDFQERFVKQASGIKTFKNRGTDGFCDRKHHGQSTFWPPAHSSATHGRHWRIMFKVSPEINKKPFSRAWNTLIYIKESHVERLEAMPIFAKCSQWTVRQWYGQTESSLWQPCAEFPNQKQIVKCFLQWWERYLSSTPQSLFLDKRKPILL